MISTTPSVGSKEVEGTTVALTVSKGADPSGKSSDKKEDKTE